MELNTYKNLDIQLQELLGLDGQHYTLRIKDLEGEYNFKLLKRVCEVVAEEYAEEYAKGWNFDDYINEVDLIIEGNPVIINYDDVVPMSVTLEKTSIDHVSDYKKIYKHTHLILNEIVGTFKNFTAECYAFRSQKTKYDVLEINKEVEQITLNNSEIGHLIIKADLNWILIKDCKIGKITYPSNNLKMDIDFFEYSDGTFKTKDSVVAYMHINNTGDHDGAIDAYNSGLFEFKKK